MSDLLHVKWAWYWRSDNYGAPDCGIYAEPRPGHAYAICRCPRYVSQDQWREFATHICDQHNAALVRAEAV